MIVAILDTETTGLADTDAIVEVAVATYDTTHRCVIDTMSRIVRPRDWRDRIGGPDAYPDASHIHGIPYAVISAAEVMPPMRSPVDDLPCAPRYILAHNARFDRDMIAQSGYSDGGYTWSDTRHFRWPRPSLSRSLTPVALAHGVPIFNAHRAAGDVDTIARLLSMAALMGLDIDAEIQRASGDVIEVRAVVSYDDRGLAGDAGCRWDPGRRWWVREVLDADYDTLPRVPGRLSWEPTNEGSLDPSMGDR